MLKDDVSDGFYRSVLLPGDAPKLGLVFLVDNCNELLVVITLNLPMVWKK